MRIPARTLKSDALLLSTAVIWGFAFVAQRRGMESIGPFAYNGVRFVLGALSLLPLIALAARRHKSLGPDAARTSIGLPAKAAYSAIAGTVLFAGASLQQVGIVTTTAGNAGFITSLYVVLVPLLGIFLGKRPNARIWIGAAVAVIGLYVLSVGASLSMSPGDLLVLVGAFFWATHILVINAFVARMEALELAFGQFAVCAAWSLAAAIAFEPGPFAGVVPAAIPILYGGLGSIGVAYTFQVVAQKTAHPAHASIILSMEALFAGIGGVLILSEPLGPRLVIGGALMLAGMVVSQLESDQRPPEGAARAAETTAESRTAT